MLPELSIRTRLVKKGRSYSDLRIRGKTKLFSLKPVRAITLSVGKQRSTTSYPPGILHPRAQAVVHGPRQQDAE